MKETFGEFYQPTDEEYKKLLLEGHVVVDTNVLLDIYRLPSIAAKELLEIFSSLKNRLWIPYHVALEFQRNRIKVAATERKKIQDIINQNIDNISVIERNIKSLQINKRDLKSKEEEIMSILENFKLKVNPFWDEIKNSIPEPRMDDPIRGKIDEIILNRIGQGPQHQGDIDSLLSDADLRFLNKIPPGFEDEKKDKSAKDALYSHNGIRYEKKFGDLIIWRQIIEHVQRENIKNLIFITGDRKADWWWEEDGKIFGPRPELIREIVRAAGIELFWMYRQDQFMKHAEKFLSAPVTSASVEDVKRVVEYSAEINDIEDVHIENQPNFVTNSSLFLKKDYDSVSKWLGNFGLNLMERSAFPNFSVARNGEVYGISILNAGKSIDREKLSIVETILAQGEMRVQNSSLMGFSLIITMDLKGGSVKSTPHFNTIKFIMDNYRNCSVIFGEADGATFRRAAFINGSEASPLPVF